MDRIRQIDPRHRGLNEGFAYLAMFRGSIPDARDYFGRQVETTPYNGVDWFMFGQVLQSQGDLVAAEQAFDTAKRVLPRGPLYVVAAVLHINLLIERRDTAKAKAAFGPLWAEYRYSNPGPLAFVLGRLGNQQEAKKLAAQLAQDPGANLFEVFNAYYALGEYDNALIWLRRVIDERGFSVTFLRLPNQYPGLQETPGYADALKYLESLQKSR